MAVSDRIWRGGLASIVAASFLACLAVDFFYFGDSGTIGDDPRFLRSAAGLLTDGRFRVGTDVAWEMPGTAILFAAIGALAPGSPVAAIRVVNAALVAAQSSLVGLLAARLFSDRLAGMLAAAIGGFYPYLLFAQGMAVSETPFDFLLVAGFLALYAWRDRGARLDARMALAVALLTAATLTKGALTLLPPLLVAAGAAGRRRWPGALGILVAATAVFAVLMAPWWLRNHALLGEFVPFTTSSTFNLYMGNSPNNPEIATYAPFLAPGWSVDHGIDLQAIPGELDRYRAFRDRAIAYIVADPGDFLRRAWIKLTVFWNIVPNAPAFQKPLYRWAGAASFGPVLALAVACLVRERRQWPTFLPFLVTIGYFTALYTLTIPSIRYRLPLEPLLIVLAAFPLALLLHRAAR